MEAKSNTNRDLADVLFGRPVIVLPAPPPVFPVAPAPAPAPVELPAEWMPAWPRISDAELLARVEMILGWQMEYVDVQERVGRLWRVNYQPMRRLDPDLLVWVGERTRPAANFDRATTAFQSFRRGGAHSAGQWQRAARRAAGRYLDAFAALYPTNHESALFAVWVRKIVSSHAAGHIFDGLGL